MAHNASTKEKPLSSETGGTDFTWVLRFLLSPESPMDERDGLIMLDNLDAKNKLTQAQKTNLKQKLSSHAIMSLESIRQLEFGDKLPPKEKFWWFHSWELSEE